MRTWFPSTVPPVPHAKVDYWRYVAELHDSSRLVSPRLLSRAQLKPGAFAPPSAPPATIEAQLGTMNYL